MGVVFDNYSKYYDLLYKDKDYSAEVDYIYGLIKKFAPNTKNVLELGCGTGKHAKLLKDRYQINTLGVDMSEKMLKQAKDLGIDCKLGDVRNFRYDKKFDAILSLFHVVSYQITDEDVLNVFNTASSHLNSEGIFIFDIWYKPAVLTQVPEVRVKEMENDEINVIRHCMPEHIIEKSIINVNYSIQIIDNINNHTEEIYEKHSMRYFSEEEIKNFAKQNGIEIIHTEEWLSAASPSEKTWGVCFVGVKK